MINKNKNKHIYNTLKEEENTDIINAFILLGMFTLLLYFIVYEFMVVMGG